LQTVKKGLEKNKAGTLTLDISPTAFIKKFLIDPAAVAPYTDSQVVMAYDYHYQGSAVTGPVSPLLGAGTTSEFDIKTAVEQALRILPSEKVVVGIPLYGYEWESLNNSPRSAVIPGTGQIASNSRAETFMENCATCSAEFDPVDQETHLIYKDEETGSFHQVFYPDKQSTTADLKLADDYNVGGVAMWALGYEGNSILNPIQDYKNSH
jgi:spore germination protein YaaH